jgi:type I restriction enzyme S subunit
MAELFPEKEIEWAYELPEGWVWAKLSDIIEPSKEKMQPPFNETEKYIGLEHIGSNTGRIVGMGKGTDVKSTKNRFYKGDVLYGKLRPYLNKTVIIDFNGICSTDLIVFRRSDFLENEYLMRFLSTQQVVSFANQNMTGVQHPRVSFDRLGQVLSPLPPLAEQRRIVAKLEPLLAQVNAAKNHLAAVPPIIKRFRQSVLAAACSGRLTEDWRREHPDVEPASELLKRVSEERIRKYEEECQKAKAEGRRKPRKPSNITQNEFAVEGLIALPNRWTWATLNDLSANEANSITDGPFGSKLKTEHYTESGPRVIRLQNIGDGKFIDARAHISPHHFENLWKHEIFGGDIVIAALGTDLPRACIIPNYVGHAIVKADCIRFKPHPSITNNQYMNASLNSDILKHIAQSIVHGVGRPRLNQQQVKSLPIPLPPILEQRAIVNRIETLFHRTSKVEERVAAATSHADRLTQSILAKAFRGELVPQDPDDEPASVLLERIRKERTELKKKKKPRKRRSKPLSDSN